MARTSYPIPTASPIIPNQPSHSSPSSSSTPRRHFPPGTWLHLADTLALAIAHDPSPPHHNLLLCPTAYVDDPHHPPDPDCDRAPECRHATAVLQHLAAEGGGGHPRVAALVGIDPPTAFALVANPCPGRGGRTLCSVIESAEFDALAYARPSESAPRRAREAYRVLWIQVALHVLSALKHLHTHPASVILADLGAWSIYLAPSDTATITTLIVGFHCATFRDAGNMLRLNRRHSETGEFHLVMGRGQGRLVRRREDDAPAPREDLFDWASLVYRLMTGREAVEAVMAGDETWQAGGMGDWHRERAVGRVIAEGRFPVLEDEFLGRFVGACWRQEYESAERLMDDVVGFLAGQGLEVGGEHGDEIAGLDLGEIRGLWGSGEGGGDRVSV